MPIGSETTLRHTFLLTWTTYATWLPGDERGWIDRDTNRVGEPILAGHTELRTTTTQRLLEPPYVMDEHARATVRDTIHAHAEHRGWTVRALNVRSNHVHVVVTADAPPEKIMGEFKAWATRRLREHGLERDHIWTRHGSTRWIDSGGSLKRAIDYVLHEQ